MLKAAPCATPKSNEAPTTANATPSAAPTTWATRAAKPSQPEDPLERRAAEVKQEFDDALETCDLTKAEAALARYQQVVDLYRQRAELAKSAGSYAKVTPEAANKQPTDSHRPCRQCRAGWRRRRPPARRRSHRQPRPSPRSVWARSRCCHCFPPSSGSGSGTITTKATTPTTASMMHSKHATMRKPTTGTTSTTMPTKTSSGRQRRWPRMASPASNRWREVAEPPWVGAGKSSDASTSGGRRMRRGHRTNPNPEQGQLPWIAYSLRDIH